MPGILRSAAVALLASLLCSCAGNTSRGFTPVDKRGALPGPEALLRAASNTGDYPTLDGADWMPSFQALAVLSDGTRADFSPSGPGNDLSNCAYAVYAFDVPDGATPDHVDCSWLNTPDECWVGVADFSINAWRFESGTTYDLSNVSQWTSSNTAFVAVIAAGVTTGTLEFVTIDSPVQLEATQLPAGFNVEYQALVSWDPDGTLGTYDWDFNGDGTVDLTDAGRIVTHDYGAPGNVRVVVSITDPQSEVCVGALSVDIAAVNQLPTARIDAVAYSAGQPILDYAKVGQDLYFSFDNSFDPDGWIDHYNVDWDSDGTYESFYLNSQNIHISHNWSTPGLKTATLRVTDNRGDTALETETVFILGGGANEVEPNNTPATATPLGPIANLENYCGQTTADADAVDYYSFSCADKTYVHVECHMPDYPGINCHPQMQMCLSDGTVLSDPGIGKDLNWSCDAGDYCIRVEDLDVQQHDYALEVCVSDQPPSAGITCDVTEGDNPLIVHLNAYDCPEGFGLGAKSIRWDINGDGIYDQGIVNNPIEDQNSFDLLIYHYGLTSISVEVTDQGNNVTTHSVDINGTGTPSEVEPNDTYQAPNQLVLSHDHDYTGHDYIINQCASGDVGTDSPGGSHEDWYVIDIPEPGTLLLDFSYGLFNVDFDLIDLDGVTVLASFGGYDNHKGRLEHYFDTAPRSVYLRVKSREVAPEDGKYCGYSVCGWFKGDGGSSS